MTTKIDTSKLMADDVRKISEEALKQRMKKQEWLLAEIPRRLVAVIMDMVVSFAERGESKLDYRRALGGIWEDAIQHTSDRPFFNYTEFVGFCLPLLCDIASAMQAELIARGFDAKVSRGVRNSMYVDEIEVAVSWEEPAKPKERKVYDLPKVADYEHAMLWDNLVEDGGMDTAAAFWRGLGERLGFDPKTVEKIGDGWTFSAMPTRPTQP